MWLLIYVAQHQSFFGQDRVVSTGDCESRTGRARDDHHHAAPGMIPDGHHGSQDLSAPG